MALQDYQSKSRCFVELDSLKNVNLLFKILWLLTVRDRVFGVQGLYTNPERLDSPEKNTAELPESY